MMPTSNNYALRVVGTPDNVTAWMRDNARHGAMRYTRNGDTFYVLGAPVVLEERDNATSVRHYFPLFAPTASTSRVYVKRPDMTVTE